MSEVQEEMKGFIVGLVCLVLVEVQCEDVEAEFRRLPKLFHLDDYEKCMEKSDGIYCLGLFQIYSDVDNNPLYDLIQEKAQDLYLYNRSYLHRGYCLPTRCPSREANETARFERCVDAWAQKRSLRARLRTLHYCRASNKPLPYQTKTSSIPHRVFLYIIYAILLMNIIGTVYDLQFRKKGQRNAVLAAFSLRINWLKLGTTVEDGDPRIDNLQVIYGFRSVMICGTIYAHVGIVVAMVYQHNPRFMERLLNSSAGAMLGSLTTVTQAYVMMSNFLTAFNLLMISTKKKIGLRMIPVLVIKRVIRIYPLYLLLNAYAATWWTSASDGPMWPLVVGRESHTCQKKFWITSAFLQNMIDPEHICLIQTWIVAVDMQIYVVNLLVVVLLLKCRKWAIKVLSLIFLAVTALTAYMAFKNKYIPAMYYMTPEVFREYFIHEKSFIEFFLQPINCAMIALCGVILAFLYVDHQAKGIKIANSKILVFLHYFAIPAFIMWSYFCSILQKNYTDGTFMAIFIVVERLVVCAISSFTLYSMINLRTPLESVFRWKGLRIFMRLSFAVSMVHWCVNMTLVATRYTLHDSSMLGLILDFLGTWALSHLIALPLTVMVEYPLQRILDRLIMNFII